MLCPFCNENKDKVIDSRETDGGKCVRRRRECLACSKRFTSYERIEHLSRLMVIKRDDGREPFSAEKISTGVAVACGKRPVSEDAKRTLVEEVDDELHREFDREVPTSVIGERVMSKLRLLDEVAYIRFASEYYRFRTIGEIAEELKQISERRVDVKNQQELF